MKVLHVHEGLDIIGGSEVYISLLCKYLPQYDIESDWVSIVFVDPHYKLKDKNENIGISSSRLDFPKRFHRFVTESGYNIIHIHGISDAFIVDTCLDVLPVVRSMHEPRIFCPGTQKFFRRSEKVCTVPFGLHCFAHAYTEGCCNRHPARLVRAYMNTFFEVKNASNRYRAIIAMSQYMKKEAVAAGIDPSRIYVNPYFVEETEMVQFPNPGKKTILFLGRLHESKGVHYLLDAFAILLKGIHQPVELHILGSGKFESVLKLQCENLGISDFVRFLGWQSREEIQKALATSDIVAVPSIYPEAFGIVGIEAMMAGKPVVGFDVGGIPDWLQHNQTGFLIPVKDSLGFAKGLERLLTDPKLYGEFSSTSRQTALQKFVPSIHLDKLIAVYQSIAQKS